MTSEMPRSSATAWKLPAWDEHSESNACDSISVYSSVKGCVDSDICSSIASTPVASARELHMKYERQRHAAARECIERRQHRIDNPPSQHTHERATSSHHDSPTTGAVDSDVEPPQPKPQSNSMATALLATKQSRLNEELVHLQRQLHGLIVSMPASTPAVDVNSEASDTSTRTLKCLEPRGLRNAVSQTEIDDEDGVVRQWIQLLLDKLQQLVQRATCLDQKPGGQPSAMFTLPNDVMTWHSVSAINDQRIPTQQLCVNVERALATLVATLEKAMRQQAKHYTLSMQKLQEVHQDQVQQLAQDSLEEIRLLRSKYKKKLDDQALSADNKARQLMEQAAEQTRQVQQLRAVIENANQQTSRFHETHESELDCLRKKLSKAEQDAEAAEKKLQELRGQLDTANAEIAIARANTAQVGEKNQEMQELLRRKCVEIEDLRAGIAEREAQHESVVDTLRRKLTEQIDTDTKRLDEHETAWQIKLEETTAKYEQELTALRTERDRLISEHDAHTVPISSCEASQTDPIIPIASESTGTQTFVDEFASPEDEVAHELRLTRRRCRALEKLLDKKFEESATASLASSSASSRNCWSCRSASADIHVDHSLRPPATPSSLSMHEALFNHRRGRVGQMGSPQPQSKSSSLSHSMTSSWSDCASSPPMPYSVESQAPSQEKVMELVRKLHEIAQQDDSPRHPPRTTHCTPPRGPRARKASHRPTPSTKQLAASPFRQAAASRMKPSMPPSVVSRTRWCP